MDMEGRHTYTGAVAGKLGIIVHPSCAELGRKIDGYIKGWRGETDEVTFIVDSKCSRFGSGEAKAQILETVRGKDIYLDRNLYSLTCRTTHQTSHSADLSDLVLAASGS